MGYCGILVKFNSEKGMFRGITAVTIDGKGRLTIPMRYREILSKDDLIVTIDTEETCLLMYQAFEWKLIEEKLQGLPSFNPAARRIQRMLIGHATEIEVDNQGRILLPPLLLDYAHFERGKKVVLIGQVNKFELWNEALWFAKREGWLSDESLDKDALPNEMKTFSL